MAFAWLFGQVNEINAHHTVFSVKRHDAVERRSIRSASAVVLIPAQRCCNLGGCLDTCTEVLSSRTLLRCSEPGAAAPSMGTRGACRRALQCGQPLPQVLHLLDDVWPAQQCDRSMGAHAQAARRAMTEVSTGIAPA